ncbi:MAG: hypothetical protein HRT40_02780 [Campylobacteraceae bacterium]|nr:hypothetical protein [Campylobacteraceae bacterium]
MAVNENRKLITGFKVAANIKTNIINILILQHNYKNNKQLKRDLEGLCR